jgi:hypothetical protein
MSHVSTIAKETWRWGEKDVFVVETVLSMIDFEIVPSEDGVVARFANYLFLQTVERFVAFAVKQRHIHVEDTKETVRNVLGASSLALGGPSRFIKW